MPRMTRKAQGVDRDCCLKIKPGLYCMNVSIAVGVFMRDHTYLPAQAFNE